MPDKRSRYQTMVFIAYGFYTLLGLAWLIMGLAGGHFNPWALGTTAIFGVQFYYRHLVTNLVLGVIFLFLSIYMLLESVNSAVAAAKAHALIAGDKILIGLCLTAIIMAGILIFSYIRLGFKD